MLDLLPLEVKDAKEKILSWLREEGLHPEEYADENAHYAIKVDFLEMPLNIIHNRNHIDSIYVASAQNFAENELRLIQTKKKMDEFLWTAHGTLLSNSAIWLYFFLPNPPHDVRSFQLLSQRIFYDTMTKEKLISSLSSIRNASLVMAMIFKRSAGTPAPIQGRKPDYLD